MISIIIPALNEEKEILFLLKSIKEQSFKGDYEIIVADNNSSDRTVEVAKQYGCRISSGGNPAEGRNKGALKAKGDLLLFVDADTVLPCDFLENSIDEFKKRNLDVASFFLSPKEKSMFLKIIFDLFYLFYNLFPALIGEKFIPHAANTILVKKEMHQKLNGFDETIVLCEDYFYVSDRARIGKFGLIKSSYIFFSTRRFKTEGIFTYCLKCLWMEFYILVFGPIRTNIFNYKFDHYKRLKEKSFLKKMEKSLIRFLREFISFVGILFSLPIVAFVFFLTIFLKILKYKDIEN